MNIDRHNYEEYFVLYVDNELNVDHARQVEVFVQQNPDLEEELIMLKQSKLTPDNSFVFDKKEILMKDENASFINMENYEEWLVLYVDNELNEEQRSIIEKFATVHPRVQQELALFKATRLEPEEIVFADKESLYKNERVAVIKMQWWKIAVAAILILAGGITLYSVVNSKGTKGNNSLSNVASNKTKDKTDATPPAEAQPSANNEQNVANTAKVTPRANDEPVMKNKKQHEQLAATTTPNRKSVIKPEENSDQKDHDNNQKQENVNLASNNKNNPNNIPRDTSQRRQFAMKESVATNVEEAQMSNAVVKNDGKIINVANVTNPSRGSPNFTDGGRENKKLRGFFRKATRLIERTTNINPANDDNKVLIGGMAINLK